MAHPTVKSNSIMWWHNPSYCSPGGNRLINKTSKATQSAIKCTTSLQLKRPRFSILKVWHWLNARPWISPLILTFASYTTSMLACDKKAYLPAAGAAIK